jgi:hypothetical protein
MPCIRPIHPRHRQIEASLVSSGSFLRRPPAPHSPASCAMLLPNVHRRARRRGRRRPLQSPTSSRIGSWGQSAGHNPVARRERAQEVEGGRMLSRATRYCWFGAAARGRTGARTRARWMSSFERKEAESTGCARGSGSCAC